MELKTVTIYAPKSLKNDYNIACARLDIKQRKMILEVMCKTIAAEKGNLKYIKIKVK